MVKRSRRDLRTFYLNCGADLLNQWFLTGEHASPGGIGVARGGEMGNGPPKCL